MECLGWYVRTTSTNDLHETSQIAKVEIKCKLMKNKKKNI